MTTDTNNHTGHSRRLRARVAAVGVALVAAAAAAGLAFAQSRSGPIGTGVVVIETSLGYQGGRAAGTGMVLTSSGVILTNNHVIRGATTIRVVVPGTGHSYTAKVVGYDVTDDVAVLRVSGGSKLKAVKLGTSTRLVVGQLVKAVGNAGGSGSLVRTAGQITGLSRTITVNDESGGTSTLRNLIETSAALQPGDSGGPLLDTAGKVIGMDSAAASSGPYSDISTLDGYAIPINRALAIAKAITAGNASATVHIGNTAFLGISAASADAQPGAVVASVVPGGPADTAGLRSGDVITAIDGTSIRSARAVSRVILGKKPGATVTVAYLDATGATQTARATLVSGPPQ